MKIFQIGSSIDNEDTANDIDLLIISDKPIDICLYTPEEWDEFIKKGGSSEGQRVVLYPKKHKGSSALRKIELKGEKR